MASNETRSKSHRTPVTRMKNSSWERDPFKSERPGAAGKGRVVQNSIKVILRGSLIVTESVFSSEENVKLRVPIILSRSLRFCVVCVRFVVCSSAWLYSSCANKRNKHDNTKAFVIARFSGRSGTNSRSENQIPKLQLHADR